jgi:acyl-CoA thioester hydrolase
VKKRLSLLWSGFGGASAGRSRRRWRGGRDRSGYLHYAEHARWEFLAAAGITQDALLATGFGPVVLDVSVKFRRELRGGDEVDVSCAFVFEGGKTFKIVQDFSRPDGRVAASLSGASGLLDLRERRLVDDPDKHFRGLATNPAVLGLA